MQLNLDHALKVKLQQGIFYVYLLLCENAIPDVELTDGSNKGFDRVEALTPLVLVLT